jgi:hypothetical protein
VSERHVIAGRIGAHESWARTPDRSARTRKAREAFNRRFEDQVDPDRSLPDAERAIRAGHARQAYFQRLSLRAAQARRRRAS